jgi:uncharacterized protein YdhG (YjbR/CyaY superfamily)
MTTPATVDEYLAAQPDERRAALDRFRAEIREAAPDAVETIAYAMPAYRLDGRFLVSFAAFKRHNSLFPASDGVIGALGDRVRPYVAGRGTLRFPLDGPAPGLVAEIVRARRAELPTGRGD